MKRQVIITVERRVVYAKGIPESVTRRCPGWSKHRSSKGIIA